MNVHAIGLGKFCMCLAMVVCCAQDTEAAAFARSHDLQILIQTP